MSRVDQRRVVVVLALVASVALSADETPTTTTVPAAPAPVEDTEGLTPRGALNGFLQASRAGDYGRAATYLDLRQVRRVDRPERGRVLARELRTVFDRALWVEVDLVNGTPEGDRDDGLAPRLEIVGTIPSSKGPVEVLLERSPAADGRSLWKVAPKTVERIPALYAEYGYGPLADLLPAPLVEIRLFDVPLWQWMGLVIVLGAAVALAPLLARLTLRLIRAVVLRRRPSFDRALLDATRGPLALAFGVGLFRFWSIALGLALPVEALLDDAALALFVLAVTWLALRLIDASGGLVERRYLERGQPAASTIVPVGRVLVKLVCALLGFVVALHVFGFNVTGLAAGLGLGGVLLALASQKTVENLFGVLTLLVDQPVRVGDLCRVGSVLGFVEDIGLRSTRVRTIDRTLVTVPNSEFVSHPVENLGRRDQIRFTTKLGLRYETTAEQLRAVLVELKRLLVAHPCLAAESAQARLVNFGASALEVEVSAYVRTGDYGDFTAIREDVLLRMMDVVAACGSGFALPSQTLYVAPDTGLDAEKARAAESRVAAWRATGSLGVPELATDEVDALVATLDFPPRGSAPLVVSPPQRRERGEAD